MTIAIRRQRIWFFIALIFSILGVGGIFGIIFGAINQNWGLLAVGIINTANLIYGTPFYWIAFSSSVTCRHIVGAVAQGYNTVSEISSSLDIAPKTVSRQLSVAISSGMITGMKFDGETLTPIVRKEPPKPHIPTICSYCQCIIPDGENTCPSCSAARRE